MKTLFLLALGLPIIVQGQYFSGEIVYKMKIISKSDPNNLEKIKESKHETTASYLITSKHYKSTYYRDGNYSYSYTYDDETKRIYDDYSDKPYVTYRDSRKSNFEYRESQIFKDSTAKILDYDCYMVISESEYGRSKTYYSEKIRVNYSDFKGHKVGNWYNKLREVNGAIALKTVTEFESYIEIQEAVTIDKRKVRLKEFEIPKKPIAASFTALDNQAEMRPPSQQQIQCYQQKTNAVSKKGGEKYTSYVSFLLQKNGVIKFVEPYGEGPGEFHKVAIDIVKNCDLQFSPGKIGGKSVDSEIIFPVEFLK
ncbi:MAG: hypothetical protein AAF519_01170 [Bacteroidota bacterium]